MWQPTASLENLKLRANILAHIRQFFKDRNILEVDTPALSQATIPSPYIQSFNTTYEPNSQTYYLQTSPEFHMKRLLAAGSGPIYQICKAFRNEGAGTRHNPEFTMLEWYRPGFDHHDLMDEMDAFLQTIIQAKKAERLTYQDVFKKYLDVDPFQATVEQLQLCASQHHIDAHNLENEDKDTWLDLLMTHIIEPNLGKDKPCFIYDFPASQAALAKIRQDTPPVAERFEVYFKGMELANGFHELTDPVEQQKRFDEDNNQRTQQNLPKVPLDEHFINALHHGLPQCAGVALGIERLLMCTLATQSIDEVITFPINHA